MSAMGAVAMQQAISAQNMLAETMMTEIKSAEARHSAVQNSIMTGVDEQAKLNKKGSDIATGAI